MPDPASAIAVAPIISAVQPFLTAVATTLIGIAVPIACAKFAQWTGFSFQTAAVQRLTAEAQTEAGAAIAEAGDNLASRSIPIGHPIVVDAASRIVATLPAVMKAAGVTPDGVARMVAGEIGKLQVQAQPPVKTLSPVLSATGAPAVPVAGATG